MKIEIPTHLSDNELVASLKGLLGREREATAQVVAHLAVMDMRDVHLREGYTSLYAYSRAVLGLSEWEAYNRIEVARDALRFPAILDLLAEGSVGLTTVKLLSSHLTPDNHLDVLASARGKSKLEVQEIVARLAPRPDVPCSVRRLQGSRPEVLTATSGSPATTEAGPGDTSPAPLGSPAVPAPAPAATSAMAPLATVKPLSPDRYKLQLTISGATLEKLQLAKDMLAHAVPSGGEEAVLDRALDALLADLTRKKFAQTSKPRSPQAAKPGSRHIPAAVKRTVWLRDLGRCAFVAKTGHHCDERRFVEFHHVDPYALGGEATVDGIELRCRHHNDYEGRLYFGRRRGGGELVPEQVGVGGDRLNDSADPGLVTG
jgi:hypothetical protein